MRPLYRRNEFFVVERLEEQGESTQVRGPAGRCSTGIARHEHHGTVQAEFAHLADELDAVDAGHRDVRKDDVEERALDEPEACSPSVANATEKPAFRSTRARPRARTSSSTMRIVLRGVEDHCDLGGMLVSDRRMAAHDRRKIRGFVPERCP